MKCTFYFSTVSVITPVLHTLCIYSAREMDISAILPLVGDNRPKLERVFVNGAIVPFLSFIDPFSRNEYQIVYKTVDSRKKVSKRLL